jgi:Fungal chitosanase of glycosyl hydrolase group 75
MNIARAGIGVMCAAALAACSGNAAAGVDGSPGPAADGAAANDLATAASDLAAVNLQQGLMQLTSTCTVASNSRYSTDDGAPATVDICKLNGAFFWNSDMDVDCDGQSTTQCSINTDPDFQNQTSFTQSDGQPLNAALLPYIVVPLPSARFDYMASNIQPGALAIVLYAGKMNYGVFGDEGPDNIIGEASYAMASSLGIDPNPKTGGVDSGVTFIVFTGNQAVPSPIEDHQAAITLGQQFAMQLLQNN